mmetsp:Transcript_443/g.1130  ORF Transcript_443/g.1130 Transcript_443/m.1130 type:complete len:314 (+) Transcript_443:5249-6190(+)
MQVTLPSSYMLITKEVAYGSGKVPNLRSVLKFVSGSKSLSAPGVDKIAADDAPEDGDVGVKSEVSRAQRHTEPSCQVTTSIDGPGSSRFLAASFKIVNRLSSSLRICSRSLSFGTAFLASLSNLANSAVAVAMAPRCASSQRFLRSALPRFATLEGMRSKSSLVPTRQSPDGLVHSGLRGRRRPDRASIVPSLPALRTQLVSTSPEPVQSMTSSTFGLPSVVTCSPAAPGSTPVSKIATTVPLPSKVGFSFKKWEALTSSFGMQQSNKGRDSSSSAEAVKGREPPLSIFNDACLAPDSLAVLKWYARWGDVAV